MLEEEDVYFDTDFSDFDASEPEPQPAAAEPSNPKKVKRSAAEAGVLLKCPKCRKGYKTGGGYKSHLLMHNVSEAARRIVSPETMKKGSA